MSHTPLSEDELTLNSLTIALPTHGYATTTRHSTTPTSFTIFLKEIGAQASIKKKEKQR